MRGGLAESPQLNRPAQCHISPLKHNVDPGLGFDRILEALLDFHRITSPILHIVVCISAKCKVSG